MNTVIILLLTFIFISQLIIIYLLIKKRVYVKKSFSPEAEENSRNIYELDDERKRTIELQLLRIRNAVQKQTEDIHNKEIELAPKSLIFDTNTLKELYPPDQQALIHSFMNSFNNYLDRYWYTDKGKLKTVFRGAAHKTDTEAGKLVLASRELCHDMDQWLKKLNTFS
ncbi:hypothetical protein [Salipaludibacillus aurantiacus]|uniref:Uncharacterized protein n=1 Tax=Salipaludibacillus aurantiacus TaxID=1601833 RepID=A0A1H9PF71_9BACI|nr:hypothetical protein [Salipaludibacillus aurantiacus]SER46203.1 hypothetical protein SAMN05518684_101257 [Salipaludibacillus aurantiacus]